KGKSSTRISFFCTWYRGLRCFSSGVPVGWPLPVLTLVADAAEAVSAAFDASLCAYASPAKANKIRTKIRSLLFIRISPSTSKFPVPDQPNSIAHGKNRRQRHSPADVTKTRLTHAALFSTDFRVASDGKLTS